MKPVSGSITSSKPISLSRAAQALSNFTVKENGASQAVSAYLKRASSSFNELIQFHSYLKSGKFDRTKHKKYLSQTVENIDGNLSVGQNRIRSQHPSTVSQKQEEYGLEENLHNFDEETGDFDDAGRKSKRKRIKEKKRRELLVESGGEGDKRKEKKRKKIEMEAEPDDSIKKHKKKRE